MAENINYSEDSIRSLDWKEHIRLRPGMYIGKLGDGSAYDDEGIDYSDIEAKCVRSVLINLSKLSSPT